MASTRFDEVSRHYQLNELNFKKKLFFLVSLMAQTYMSGNLYDEIIPGLLLGKIPTEEEAKILKEKIPNLNLVVSVNEDFELNGKVLAFDLKLQPPAKWKEMGIRHHQLIATDFTADMAIEDTLKTINIIHNVREKGGSVYVHCKAGRGRSVTVIVLYLLLYGCKEAGIEPKIDMSNLSESSSVIQKDIQALYEFIRTKRTQVNLKEHNFEKINEVVSITVKNGFPPKAKLYDGSNVDRPDLKNRLNEYLASLDAKEEIAQLNSFKHLKFYAIDNDNSNRKRIIQNFLNDILNANDASWYFRLFNQEGPAQELLDARPMNGLFGGKPIRRLTLLDDFKKDLTELLCTTLKCTAYDLECLVDMYRCQQEYPALKKPN